MADDRQQLLERADRAMRRGDAAEAASQYRRLLNQTPNDLNLMQRLGDALARAGQLVESRSVFRKLADEYWKGGHRQRALAVMRRAVRLGEPDSALLALLGRRLLELGLAADARAPLLEAAKLAEGAADVRTAHLLYTAVADSLPKDVVARESLLRLANRAGAPAQRAAALMRLATVRVRLDEARAALDLLGEAFDADLEELTALTGLPELLKAFVEALPAEIPETAPSDRSPAASACWLMVRAALAERLDPRGASQLVGALTTLVDLPARARLWGCRDLLQRRRIDELAQCLHGLADELSQDLGLRQELADLTSSVVARRAGDQRLLDLLRELTGAPPAAARDSAISGAEAESDVSGRQRLPADIQGRIVEAEAFRKQGLVERARQALGRIPPQWRTHADVVRLQEDLAPVRGGKRTPAGAQAAPAGRADDDVFVVITDEAEAGSARPTARAGAPPLAARRAAGTVDLSVLGRQVEAGIDPAEIEMSYQMALGLMEMGLMDQAVPLLERALWDPARQIDAVLLLAEARVARGEQERALAEVSAVRKLAGEAAAPLAGELLATLTDLALRVGLRSEALAYLAELSECCPTHQALVDLRERLGASTA